MIQPLEWDEPEEIIDPWEDCPRCEEKDELIEELQNEIDELTVKIDRLNGKFQQFIREASK